MKQEEIVPLVAKLTGDLAKSVPGLTKDEARFLVNYYYLLRVEGRRSCI